MVIYINCILVHILKVEAYVFIHINILYIILKHDCMSEVCIGECVCVCVTVCVTACVRVCVRVVEPLQ